MRFILSSLFLTLAVTFQSCLNNTDPVTQINDHDATTALKVKQTVEPAFADFNVPLQTLKVKGTQAQTLQLPSGSSIDVPATAFVDAKGAPVKGDVKLVFREFHNAAEIIASGIPMKVMEENGEEGWMQTAGMYELNGFQDGQPVFIAPGKSLNVNLVSAVDGEYGFWNFDPEAGNWDNLGTSIPTLVKNTEKRESDNIGIPKQAGPPPAAPIAFRNDSPPIDLDINLNQFPELAGKQGIVWQYAGKDSKQDPANNPGLFRNNWEEISLQPNTDGQTYTLTLANDDEEMTLPVAPALKGKDLEQAIADYQRRLADYQKRQADVQEVNSFVDQQKKFVRSFEVQGFGIYNYDILIKMDDAIPILANFDFGTEIRADMRRNISVFLVSGDGRMVVKFPPSDWKKFRIDPNLENSLVAILPDNKLATLSAQDLKKQLPAIRDARGKEFVFQLKAQDTEVKTLADVKDQLAAL